MRSSIPRKDGAISEELLTIAWEIVRARSAGGPCRAYGTRTPGNGRAATGEESGSQADRSPEGSTSPDRKIRTHT
jgi:hypothetical protein